MKSRIVLPVVFEDLENTTSNFTLCFLIDSRSGWFHEWASQGRMLVHTFCIMNGNWLVCLKVGITGGGLFGSQKRTGISWQAEGLLASQELCPPSPVPFVELVMEIVSAVYQSCAAHWKGEYISCAISHILRGTFPCWIHALTVLC